jgi:hypothetical protein
MPAAPDADGRHPVLCEQYQDDAQEHSHREAQVRQVPLRTSHLPSQAAAGCRPSQATRQRYPQGERTSFTRDCRGRRPCCARPRVLRWHQLGQDSREEDASAVCTECHRAHGHRQHRREVHTWIPSNRLACLLAARALTEQVCAVLRLLVRRLSWTFQPLGLGQPV